MAWVFFVLGAALVVAIAFYAVGKVTGEMASQRPPAIYELPLAVEWIADRLPDEVTARISYEDVARILTWHLDWFGAVGVASEHGQQLGGTDALHDGSVAIEDAAVDAVVAKSIDADFRRVQFTADTEIQFNDPARGFRRLTGTNDFVADIVEELVPIVE